MYWKCAGNIFYPQISLRYYKEMNQDIYDRALRILGSGSTFPMLYNDDVNVPAVMRAMDVPKKAAEQYSFFGCGEYMLAVQSIGNAKYSPECGKGSGACTA